MQNIIHSQEEEVFPILEEPIRLNILRWIPGPGIIITSVKPENITGFPEIVKKKCIFVNRPLGSGTRLRLDLLLNQVRINMHDLIGYKNEVETHNEVGKCILDGKADAGLGLAATAYQCDWIFYIFSRNGMI